MGPILAAAIPAVASLAGGLFGMQGQTDANQANAHQAKLNRDFQERLSNTSFQRGVADIKAAGLNPAMAYGHGGASSPSGAQAQIQNALGHTGSGISAAGATAATIAAQVAKIREETRSIQYERNLKAWQSQWHNAILGNESTLKAAEAQYKTAAIGPESFWIQQRRQAEADIKLTESHARTSKYGEADARNAEQHANRWWEQYISPFITDAKGIAQIGSTLALPGAIGSAGRALRSGKTIGIRGPATAKAARRTDQDAINNMRNVMMGLPRNR